MFRNVQLRVKQTIGRDPWLSFPSLPAVYFAGTKPPENLELMFWASVKESTNPAVLNTYLQRYPNGEFASVARALIERYERQLKAELTTREEERKRQEEVRKAAEVKRLEEERQKRDIAVVQERQRAQDIKNFAEGKRIEEQQLAEIAARTEELRKAQDAVRMAREAAAAAEQERLAAVKAAEEAKERVKIAGLPPAISEQVNKDPLALARALQTELKRVGCDPGAVNGQWGKEAKEALANFAQLARVSLTVEEPTQGALQAVASKRGRICAANVKSVGEAEV